VGAMVNCRDTQVTDSMILDGLQVNKKSAIKQMLAVSGRSW
jgi:hypothetical protein